jgi:succinate dehydrogenase hydrophobic anchor subunit
MRRRLAPGVRDPDRWWARAFGGIFLASAAVHLVFVTVTPNAYDSFADGSWWPFVTHAWHSAFIPNFGFFIALLITFEAAVGLLVLSRAYRRVGIAAAIVFNAALILFGWGFCLWSVPVIALLIWFWHLESASDSKAAASSRYRPVAS